MRTSLRLPGLEGPALRWPAVVDRAAEWWARSSPRRRQLVRVLVIAALVLVAARPRPHAWGPQTTVLVAARALDAGTTVTADDVAVLAWPSALAPPGAITTAAQALGQVLVHPVAEGLPVDHSQLGSPSAARLAPPGWVAMSVDAALLPAMTPGTVLDIHAGDGGSVTGAMVLQVAADLVWLGLTREQGPALAAALAWGEPRVALWAPEDQPSRTPPPTGLG